MQPSPIPLPACFATARDAARKAWLILAAVALVPGWSAARAMPGFFTVDNTTPLSDGAPNVWAIVQALPWIGDVPLAGLAMAMAIGAGAWLAAHCSARPPRGDAVWRAALLVALTLPMLLPYARSSDFVLALVLAIGAREWRVASLVAAGYLLAIIGFSALGAVPIALAITAIARPFLDLPANDNGLPLNRVMVYPA